MEWSSQSSIAPEELKLNFIAQPGHQMSFNLTFNDNIPSNVPVLVGKSGKVEAWQQNNEKPVRTL